MTESVSGPKAISLSPSLSLSRKREFCQAAKCQNKVRLIPCRAVAKREDKLAKNYHKKAEETAEYFII